jgi:predicted TIM-barrel fold metal-dependent hydrolase
MRSARRNSAVSIGAKSAILGYKTQPSFSNTAPKPCASCSSSPPAVRQNHLALAILTARRELHLEDDSMPDSFVFSRRAFHSGALAGLAVASGVGSLCAASEDRFPKGAYVDVHTHIGQTWNTTVPLTSEELLRWMDAHSVAQAVVLPLSSPESSSYLITTDFVLAQTAPFRDRLIPFCCIDPRTSYTGGHKGLVAMLRKYVEAGAKGFGEHKPGLAIDDPRSMELYAGCAELKLPLLFHIDNQRNLDKPGLPGLAKALAAHPDCNFIGHGPGWWASISGDITQNDLGGYPKGKVALGGAIDALMEKYPNLYADLSAGSGAGAISRDLEFGRDFLIRRQDRVLFGTDFLAPKQAVPQFDLFERQLKLPEEVQAKILRNNTRRVLGLG